MLIKLIAVDSCHFIRYKCKITHCPDSQTLSEYISTIVLDDNEKLLINVVLDVLIGAGTFTSTSSSGTQFVTMNALKKSVPVGLYFFYVLLGSSIVSPFCWKNGQIYLSIVQEYQAWKNCVPDADRVRLDAQNL